MKTSTLLLIASSALAAADPAYQLHEWGTFTTVSGSDGILLTGLEREEEPLPGFVHSHAGFENNPARQLALMTQMMERHGMPFMTPGSKGFGYRPVAGVTVKMETPVLYFHSPEAFDVKVKIGFAGGTISQWYPARSAGEVLPEPPAPADPKRNPTPLSAWLVDFTKGYQGSIEWEVKVLSPEESRDKVLFKPQDTLGWLRARVPGSNALRTSSGETEGYLFYRGMGRFDPGLKTTVDSGETLHVTNRTGAKISYLVAFERTAGGELRWTDRKDGLEAGNTLDLAETDLKLEAGGFEPLYQAVKSGLTHCGLTEAESRAMVETWWQSYFEAPGLRVFWVVPRETTDRILPLEVSPAPASLVRVIVGRSEVFRPRDETKWQQMASVEDSRQSVWPGTVASHRFGLPMNERVMALRARASR